MKTIEQKLAIVRAVADSSWTDKELRHLIHGVGGSPRRAKRLIVDAPDAAISLLEQFSEDMDAGVPFKTAAIAAAARFAERFPPAEVAAETESETETETETEPTPAPVKRKAKAKAESFQPALV